MPPFYPTRKLDRQQVYTSYKMCVSLEIIENFKMFHVVPLLGTESHDILLFQIYDSFLLCPTYRYTTTETVTFSVQEEDVHQI